ncbi:predicted protein [Sclerotinia sclerotiorum 1980 UF-70]|uniref:Uncharacterized protein n=1 Tax=Sclerotinia sclerotiorum (strain ATCC 18683 / 1980 / Ss-1) TaxID=665079 RepID=A7E6B6_SCLS1|nr:predicted protein [Sclerotinia sclerotiorum 1980 UF-70]EDN91438.1 predicted protein [Sclerotinia sclerotiorum 1980 UF-70]
MTTPQFVQLKNSHPGAKGFFSASHTGRLSFI